MSEKVAGLVAERLNGLNAATKARLMFLGRLSRGLVYAGGITLLAACGKDTVATPTPAPLPTEFASGMATAQALFAPVSETTVTPTATAPAATATEMATQTASPTETPKEQLPSTEAPIVARKPSPTSTPTQETPTATPTVTATEHERMQFSMNAYLEKDANTAKKDTLHFSLSDSVLEELKTAQKEVSLFFSIESSVPIKEFSIELSSILGDAFGLTEAINIPVSDAVTTITAEDLTQHIVTALGSKGYKLDQDSLEAVGAHLKIELARNTGSELDPNVADRMGLRITFPGDALQVTGPNGTFNIKIPSEFMEHRNGIGVLRSADTGADYVLGIKDFQFRVDGGEKDEKILKTPDVIAAYPRQVKSGNQPTPFPRATVTPASSSSSSAASTPFATSTRAAPVAETRVDSSQSSNGSQVTIQKSRELPAGATPEALQQETSKKAFLTTAPVEEWPTKEWKEGEYGKFGDWWEDQVSKGNIRIGTLAYQYAADDVADRLNHINTLLMVPDSKGFYQLKGKDLGTGDPNEPVGMYMGCKAFLQFAVDNGQGEVTIKQPAFDAIPGGAGCQLFNPPSW
ncbi:hypothetical protein KA082_00880 [Candidatus Woesebacteria bacterium]|nr:hypothetical protein [Candidatus Woesebacteria bacterium]